jgi:hypothetical protein
MESAGARYAWYGRVSTEDEQDPTLSFPRRPGRRRSLQKAWCSTASLPCSIRSWARQETARGPDRAAAS